MAYSLQLLDDRDLWLVLPKNTEFPTLRRAAWLSPKIRVWTIDEAGELREHPIPARPEERIRWRDVAVRVGVAGLGDRAEWITPLLDWARAAPDVVDTSRESYVDFQCDGRSILKITPAVDHLDVRAGTDWKKPDTNKPKAECLKVTGPLRSEEIHRLVGAASRSAAARLSRRIESTRNTDSRLVCAPTTCTYPTGVGRCRRYVPPREDLARSAGRRTELEGLSTSWGATARGSTSSRRRSVRIRCSYSKVSTTGPGPPVSETAWRWCSR